MAFRTYKLSIESPNGQRKKLIDTFNTVGPIIKRVNFWRENKQLRGATFVLQNVHTGWNRRFAA